jgi:hypothetical protein
MVAMLMLFMLAEAAAAPPAPPQKAEAEKCVILIEYRSVVPDVPSFGWSAAAKDQSERVARIIAVKREVQPATESPPPEAKLPEKEVPTSEPAVQSPECTKAEPAGQPKRRKKDRLT